MDLEPVSGGWIDRLRAGIVTVALCLAVLAPLVPDADGRRRDDFPLTWYPMFRGIRPPYETVQWVRATLVDGSTRNVPVGFWTPGGITEGSAHLERAIRSREGPKFCAAVARTVAKNTRGWPTRVVTLSIVRTRWRLTEYFGAEAPEPVDERILSTCAVPR